jgi:hypothetical protein
MGRVDKLNKLSLARANLTGDEKFALDESFKVGGIDKLHSINDLCLGFSFSHSRNSVT